MNKKRLERYRPADEERAEIDRQYEQFEQGPSNPWLELPLFLLMLFWGFQGSDGRCLSFDD
jgi:hypothetical protein